jgi:hypothetical protein
MENLPLSDIPGQPEESARFVALATVPSQVGAMWLWNPIKAATGHTAVGLTVDHPREGDDPF